MAFVTAVLVQKETGGNLAEILEQIATVIRGRFRFQRKSSHAVAPKAECPPGFSPWCR